ncbi:Cyclic nucleotide-gated olfactory channel [Holothuria leucospilota]|uniref:Cyclic nucleotide-gated olfactory channel n=1 Tax=Holothuria leucospilota TaxID=206669 RepID=A0A9Q1CS62_HOLLE|nr:Cyclic nucleotide-gated olfactory channel [Holothuria leucospilota]
MENTVIIVDDVPSSDELLPGQLNGGVRTGKIQEIDKVDQNGDVRSNFLQPMRSRIDSQSCPDLAYLPSLLPEPSASSQHGDKEKDGGHIKRKESQRSASTIWTSIRAVIQLRSAATAKRRRQKNSTARTDSFLEKFTTRHHHFVDENDGNKSNEERINDDDLEPFSFVVEPDGDFLFYWLSIVSVAVLYNFWFLIAREAWQEIQIAAPAVWFSLDYLCDFIYILDIIVQLRTGYLEHGLLVKSSKRLAFHYIRSLTFLADIVSLLPTDIFYVVIGVHSLLRFPRFLKVYRVSEFYYKVETSTQHPNGLRVVNLIHILLLLTHWFAAVYFILGEILGSRDGIWSYQNIDDESQNTTARKYLSSVYWSTITLTTIGDIPNPQSNWQIYYSNHRLYDGGIHIRYHCRSGRYSD